MRNEIFSFPIRNGNLRSSKKVDGAYTRTVTRGRGENKHSITFHLVGRQAEIRANDRWRVTKLERDLEDIETNSFHVRCDPTTEAATVDRFALRDQTICFSLKTRTNSGRSNNGANCRQPVAARA